MSAAGPSAGPVRGGPWLSFNPGDEWLSLDSISSDRTKTLALGAFWNFTSKGAAYIIRELERIDYVRCFRRNLVGNWPLTLNRRGMPHSSTIPTSSGSKSLACRKMRAPSSRSLRPSPRTLRRRSFAPTTRRSCSIPTAHSRYVFEEVVDESGWRSADCVSKGLLS